MLMEQSTALAFDPTVLYMVGEKVLLPHAFTPTEPTAGAVTPRVGLREMTIPVVGNPSSILESIAKASIGAIPTAIPIGVPAALREIMLPII